MSRKTTVTRRGFLAGTGSLLAMPTLIGTGCAGTRAGVVARRPAPSSRLNVGFIGYGTMACDNIGNFLNDDRVQVVSICDCVSEGSLYGYQAERQGGREPGRRRVNQFYAEKLNRPDYNGCRTHNDFRDMLDRDDLDAVVISTPDHWHAVQAIWAARKGIHVYGQKPLSLSIAEGRAMSDEVRKAGVIFQTGSQQRSENYFRIACEFVRNGRLGRLDRIEVGLPGGRNLFGKSGADACKEPLPHPPPHVDFDLWLGPAPRRPFIPALHNPLSWRENFDYSGGMITDWGAHHLDIVQWALGKDGSGPVALENIRGEMPRPEEVFNTAPDYSFEVVYAEGVRVFVSNRFPNGVRFVGEGGREIFVTRGRLEMKPEGLIRQRIQEHEINLYRSGQHERNFIDCIFSNQETITTCEIGHRSITVAQLANIGLRLGRASLRWDPARERIPGDREAERLMAVPLRRPWTLNMKV